MLVDCLIAGDGIAGLSTAIGIARTTDLTVALISVPKYQTKTRVGEVVPPDVRIELSKLGLWERFTQQNHIASSGVSSWWGGSDPIDRDFIYNPNGKGWNLDRLVFEEMLRSTTENLKIQTYSVESLKDVRRVENGLWSLSNQEVKAHFLINASGRSNSLTRFTGDRKVFDKLVAYVQYFDVSSAKESWNSRLWIEACVNGWWYSALLPSNSGIVVFLSDSDINTGSFDAIFADNLNTTFVTKSRVSGCVLKYGTQVFPANTSKSDFDGCANALTVGDASFTSDPLRGMGIFQCLKQALTASETIGDYFGSNVPVSHTYTSYLENEFEKYYGGLFDTYSIEQRWSTSPFWSRRSFQ